MDKDYYKILEIEKGASKEEVKKAYKRLAKKYHPDVNKDLGSEAKFKEISEAASILGDDQKRQQYDQYGTTYDQFTGHGFDFGDFGFSGFDFDFDDIFSSIFGGSFGSPFGGRKRSYSQRGADLQYNMEISLEDAAFGSEKEIVIPHEVICSSCNGSGADKPSDISTCGDCNGSGSQKTVKRTPFGMFQTQSVCRSCEGQGRIITNRCSSCNGSGTVHERTKLKVQIPAGANDGTNLRLSGKGESLGKGGSSGDLYIVLRVAPHEQFERKGDDLILKVKVDFPAMALGDEIVVPTIDGKATLRIPPGTQPGTVFRMRGKGIQHLRGFGRGDQNVVVTIDVPTKLTKRQKEILKEFNGPGSKKKGLFRK